VGTLFLCHGVFGSLHLACYSPECAGGAEHAAEHQPTAGTTGDGHEHPVDHATSTGYLAVVAVGLIGLLLRQLPQGALFRIRLDLRWPAHLRRVPAVFRPPPTPIPRTLQVFRL
jgi:hypothetical protein